MGEPRPKVKICGLTRAADALAADRLGADYLGVVLSAGFSRSVDAAQADAVVRGTSAVRVAVLVDEPPAAAVERARSIGASVLQLHGEEDRATVSALKDAGSWAVWKAVRARTADDVRRVADTLGDVVDGLLVEGWREGAVGGSGLRVELDPISLRAALPDGVTFVLAGGLRPDSVAEAVARFAPDVVDVSSGVERAVGRKDERLVAAFLRAARGVSASEPEAP